MLRTLRVEMTWAVGFSGEERRARSPEGPMGNRLFRVKPPQRQSRAQRRIHLLEVCLANLSVGQLCWEQVSTESTPKSPTGKQLLYLGAIGPQTTRCCASIRGDASVRAVGGPFLQPFRVSEFGFPTTSGINWHGWPRAGEQKIPFQLFSSALIQSDLAINVNGLNEVTVMAHHDQSPRPTV